MKAASPIALPPPERRSPVTHSVRFPTALGECALSWSERGVTAFALPDTTPAPAAAQSFATAGGAARQSSDPSSVDNPQSPPHRTPATVHRPPTSVVCPPEIAALVVRIQRHLAGDLQDFADVAYDWSCVTEFQSRVLRALLAIGPGRTATYGDLGRAIGAPPGAARAIGGAVGTNPWPLLIPCHRILGSTGKLTGYSAPGGLATKARLLEIEGVELLGRNP